MNGIYLGLPRIGSAYVEVRREWLGTGIERREHDTEVWVGWLHATVSKPSRKPRMPSDDHDMTALERNTGVLSLKSNPPKNGGAASDRCTELEEGMLDNVVLHRR